MPKPLFRIPPLGALASSWVTASTFNATGKPGYHRKPGEVPEIEAIARYQLPAPAAPTSSWIWTEPPEVVLRYGGDSVTAEPATKRRRVVLTCPVLSLACIAATHAP